MSLPTIIDEKLFNNIPNQPQVQCSTSDQMQALIVIMEKFGLNKACKSMIDRKANQYATKALDNVVDENLLMNIPLQTIEEETTLDQELWVSKKLAVKFGLYDAADLINEYRKYPVEIVALSAFKL